MLSTSRDIVVQSHVLYSCFLHFYTWISDHNVNKSKHRRLCSIHYLWNNATVVWIVCVYSENCRN